MKAFNYILGGLLVVAVLVFGIAAIMLATFDPNNYKDDIQAMVLSQTGRTLNVEGPISLSYFPVLGFSIAQASLSNPPKFPGGSFASFDEIQAGVKLLPLLGGIIEIDTIRLVRPVISVIRRPDGETNLSLSKENTAQIEGKSYTIRSGKIEITDGTLSYEDQGSDESYTIKDLNFSLSSFVFQKSASASLSGVLLMKDTQIALEGNAEIAPDNNFASVDISGLDVRADIKNSTLSETVALSLQGDIDADMNAKTAALKKGQLEWNDTAIALDGSYNWDSTPNATFKVKAESINIDDILAAFSPKSENTGGDETALPTSLLKDLSLDGTLDIGTLQVMKLTFSDVRVTVKGQNGVIDFNPVGFNFYEGSYTGQAQLDVRGSILRASEQGHLQNVQIGPAMGDLFGQNYVTGTGNLNYDVSSSGNTVGAMMSNLGGTASLSASDGFIEYGQLSKRINQAIAYFENRQISDNVKEEVQFTSLNASFIGQSGVFRNDDLKMLAPRSHALGNGQINLRNNTVDYTSLIGLGTTEEEMQSADHLPLRISGPFTNLSYGLDVKSLIREQAGEKIEEKKQELLDKAFNKLGIGGNSSDASQEKGSDLAQEEDTSTTTQEDAAKDMLKEFLGGGQ
jgi:uncharacterized protein involved in outer membrane biogenesis